MTAATSRRDEGPTPLLPTSEPVVIPTVEFTVHYDAAQPAGEWFFIEQRTTWSTGSSCVDEAELRTTDGALVAQPRQLRRLVPGPDGSR
jgi:hypothetical protein